MEDIRQSTDYSPFGLELHGRTVSSDEYRYGFNGMEADNEVKGSGNSYTTEFRQYDPRLGRWLSIDPVVKVHESPYASFANNPIWFGDKDGADTLVMHMTEVVSPSKDVILWKVTFTFIQEKVEYNLTPSKEIYFGMPREAYNQPGNKQPMNELIGLAFETGKSMAENHNSAWNENVMHLGGAGSTDGQFFHPSVDLSQSIGCFLACDYPVRKTTEGGDVYYGTGSDNKALASKQKLTDIRTTHNQAIQFNNDPTLDFFVKFGSPTQSNTQYTVKEEPLPYLKTIPLEQIRKED